MRFKTGGSPSSSIVRMRVGMTRSTMPDGPALLEDVAAETAEAGHAVGEVHFLDAP